MLMLIGLLSAVAASPAAAAPTNVSVGNYGQNYTFPSVANTQRLFTSRNGFYNFAVTSSTSGFAQSYFVGMGTATSSTISTGNNSAPYAIAFSPDESIAFVTLEGYDTIAKVNLGTFPVTVADENDQITVGDNPRGIVLGTTPTSSGKVYAYVANYESNSVSVVDVAADNVLDDLGGFDGPESITMSADGAYVYVGNRGDGSATANTSIMEINTADNSIRTIAFPNDLTTEFTSTPSPTWLEMSPNGEQLYFVNQNTNQVIQGWDWLTEVFGLNIADGSQAFQLKRGGIGGATFGNKMKQIAISRDDALLAAGDGDTTNTTNKISIYPIAGLNTNDYPIPPVVSSTVISQVRAIALGYNGISGDRRFILNNEDSVSVYGPSTPAPVITSVAPSSGPVVGGTVITILGTDLASSTVTIGNQPCTSVTAISGGITCVTPESATTGLRNVTVMNTTGGAISTDAFTYGDPAPTISGIEPDSGPLVGGNTITITGADLTGAAVTIGGNVCVNVEVDDEGTSLTCDVPEGSAAEAVDVVVTTTAGTTTSTDGYTYVSVPAVSAIDPDNGPLAGGGEVTITGTDLDSATVTIGGVACTDVEVTGGGTTLTCTVPPGSTPGAVDVVVTTPGGSGTLTDGYTYNPAPTVTEVDPSQGPVAGGNTITITGTNLTNATVLIGGDTCASPVVNEAGTELTCTVPGSESPGTASVVITTPTGGSTTVTDGYTYVAEPVIATISPNEGPLAGGNEFTITGTGLTGPSVTVGGLECTDVEVNIEGTSLTCTVPEGVALATVDVVVTTFGGQVAGEASYTYVAAPTVATISPDNGPLAGTNELTITGTNLTAATVTIDGNECTDVAVNDEGTSLTCTVPAGTDPGAVAVAVTTSGGTVTEPTGYTYNPLPAIATVSPNAGPVTGTNTVTITGTDLDDADVTIGGLECTNVVVNEAGTSLTCTVPAGSVGPVDVEVTTPQGSATATGGYTYVAAPTVSTISPDNGPLPGGNTLTITGTNLTNATVLVGGNVCTDVEVNEAGTSLTCDVPAGNGPGAVDVTVSTAGGSADDEAAYTYNPAPSITTIDPSQGPVAGGNTVTITGANLTGATVTIGGDACTPVVVNEGGTSLTCAVPAGSDPGAVDVAVTTTSGGTTTTTGGYTYVGLPTVSAISPDNGPLAGGNQVTITGTHLVGATVLIDGAECTEFAANEAGTSATCTVPAGAAPGAVAISVETAGGTVTQASAYTYNPAPTVTEVSPNSGPVAGGTTITITGSNLTGATVTIGGTACTEVSVAEDGLSLTCVVPAGAVGPADVVVSTTAGGTVTLPGAFTYTGAEAAHVPNKPRDLTVKGKPTAKKFTIKWVIPTMTNDGRPVDGYRLTLRQKGFKKLIVLKNLPSSKTNFTVTRKYLLKNTQSTRGDMGKYFRYVVKVEALNSKGGGPISKTNLFVQVRR